MQITEAEVKHTPDAKAQATEVTNTHSGITWRAWKQFPRWDIRKLVLDEKEDKEKYLRKIGENLICQSTYSGKHHITYWKNYKSAEEYEKDQ